MIDLGIGFFKAFKDRNTVLVSCTDTGLIRLRNLLSDPLQTSIPLHQYAEIAPHYPTTLFVTLDQTSGDGFIWTISESSRPHVLAALSTLAQSSQGHRYFDLANSGTQLMISLNEYDSSWWAVNA